MFRSLFVVLALALATPVARAVEMNGGYDTTAPTDSDIPGWDSGWGEDDITGWDYVGTVNNASAVYLGNGWVLTAGHVGVGDFILTTGSSMGTYIPTGVSYSISDSNGTADLTLFQVASAPSLPPLSLATSDPTAFLPSSSGSPVVMIGYGGGNKSWGYDQVTLANQLVSVDGYSYNTTDFITSNGEVSNGMTTHTNNSQLVSGDSGGGDFIYNSSLGEWQLAGINEAIGTGSIGEYDGQWYLADDAADLPPGSTNVQNNVDFSAMVQIDAYESQIEAIVDAPEPPVWAMLLVAGGAAAMLHGARPRRRTVERAG